MSSTDVPAAPVKEIKKRNTYTFLEKNEVRMFYKTNKISYAEVARHFSRKWNKRLTKNTVCNWLSGKNSQTQKLDEAEKKINTNPEQAKYICHSKKIRVNDTRKLEEALYQWVQENRPKPPANRKSSFAKIPFPDTVLLERARIIADADIYNELEIPEGFEYSHGWLTRFKKRHGLESAKRAKTQAARKRSRQETNQRKKFQRVCMFYVTVL